MVRFNKTAVQTLLFQGGLRQILFKREEFKQYSYQHIVVTYCISELLLRFLDRTEGTARREWELPFAIFYKDSPTEMNVSEDVLITLRLEMNLMDKPSTNKPIEFVGDFLCDFKQRELNEDGLVRRSGKDITVLVW